MDFGFFWVSGKSWTFLIFKKPEILGWRKQSSGSASDNQTWSNSSLPPGKSKYNYTDDGDGDDDVGDDDVDDDNDGNDDDGDDDDGNDNDGDNDDGDW